MQKYRIHFSFTNFPFGITHFGEDALKINFNNI